MSRYLALLLLAVLIIGCSEDPAGPGGKCDVSDKESCESGLECAENAEGKPICQHPEGADCDAAADLSFCIVGTECVATMDEAGELAGGQCLISAGGECELETSPSLCTTGTECVATTDEAGEPAGAQCLIPLGSECDLEANPSYCAGGGECFDFAEPSADMSMMSDPEPRCALLEGAECDPSSYYCAPELVCAERTDSTFACHPRFYIQGTVRDATDAAAIEGAHVLSLNEESIAITDIAITDAEGRYQLELPSVRETDGAPVSAAYTLRSSAQDYQTFPGGLRTALPINTAEAAREGDNWIIEGSLTEITLIPLQDTMTARYTITGSVLSDEKAGVLVVADDGAGSLTAVSSSEGNYTIFNVPDGDYTVKGYAADLQLEPVDATVSGQALEGVDLSPSDTPLITVGGNIQLVNPGDGDATSVVLVVKSTFDEGFGRGEVPPGLRAPRTGAPDVNGDWEISGVPAGEYVVLAAFENDLLVRDPDTNISGTSTVSIEVKGDEADGRFTMPDSFKVTGALAVVAPGAGLPDTLTEKPTLEWEDDSSEAYYIVEVYNSYGEKVWETQLDGVSGQDTVTVDYDGPFEAGIYYQFRATSWRSPGGNDAPISMTEDLLGVFQAAPAP